MSPKTRAAVAFIDENIHRNIHVAEVAHSVCLSRSRLSCLFRIELEVAPTQYLKKVRMERARQLLRATFLSVKEIGATVGFKDCSHSMREFKKACGLTPSQYRAVVSDSDSQRVKE
jgi:transcriptional regulator GlxA family with amidase domain